MSVKVNLEIISEGHTARCSVEVPLEAIGVTGTGTGEREQNQKRITDFTTTTIESVLTATSQNGKTQKETTSSMLESASGGIIKIEKENDTNPKKRKHETENESQQRKGLAPPVVSKAAESKDMVNISVRKGHGSNPKELRYCIGRSQPLRSVLESFAKHIDRLPQILRFTDDDGRRIHGDDTTESLGLEDGDVIEAWLELTGS